MTAILTKPQATPIANTGSVADTEIAGDNSSTMAVAYATVHADASGDFEIDLPGIFGHLVRLSVVPVSDYDSAQSAYDPSGDWTLTVANPSAGAAVTYAIPTAGDTDVTGGAFIVPIAGRLRIATSDLNANARVRISAFIVQNIVNLAVGTQPTSYSVGDDVNFIRLNPTTKLIEYGGTMRPVVPVPIFGNARYYDYFAPTLYGSGSKARFYLLSADGDSTAFGSAFRRIGKGWDLSANIAMKAVVMHNAPIVAATNDNLVTTAAVVVVDYTTTRIDLKTSDWESVNDEHTIPASGGNYRVPREITLGTDIDLSAYDADNGPLVSAQFGRDGAHANDNLGTELAWMDVWLEVTLRSNAGV